MSPRADGSDGHRLKSMGRLDPEGDAWIRAYAEEINQPVLRIVRRAVREFRERIEHETSTPEHDPEEITP